MANRKYRLKGHESFVLREGWLTKGLMSVNKDARLFSQNNGADALGVGTNMAKSIRYWMKAAGLMTENSVHGATLTPVGRAILKNDPYFEDVFSLWIVHANIASNYELATSWNVYFNSIKATSFRREELANMMMEQLLESTKELQLPERSVKDDSYSILAMYADVAHEDDDPEDKKTSPFAELGLIKQNGPFYERLRPDVTKIDPMAILYLLEKYFEDDKSDSELKSIQIDDIVESDDLPGKLYNMNRIMVNDCLDVLHNKGFVTVNRTAGLDVVYQNKKMTREDVVNAYYKARG